MKDTKGQMPLPSHSELRQSMDMRAANLIRQYILDGHMVPGERITEQPLAEMLQLSRGTIRAALRYLINERLVVQEPYRGYRVTGLTSHDVWELFTLRNSLEALGTKLAAEKRTSEVTAAITAAFDRLKTAVTDNDRRVTLDADFGLHREIIRISGHNRLRTQYETLESQVRLYLNLTGLYYDLDEYVTVHEDLIRAILEGDARRAEVLAANHNTAEGIIIMEKMKALEASRHGSRGSSTAAE